ncbi:hypothetical protein C8R45DRAFT_357087 [Mycena sanguinolenta]|nr:hypothetical protein C8R45DRAFT_357087 [Mycena sanguinolenta]
MQKTTPTASRCVSLPFPFSFLLRLLCFGGISGFLSSLFFDARSHSPSSASGPSPPSKLPRVDGATVPEKCALPFPLLPFHFASSIFSLLFVLDLPLRAHCLSSRSVLAWRAKLSSFPCRDSCLAEVGVYAPLFFSVWLYSVPESAAWRRLSLRLCGYPPHSGACLALPCFPARSCCSHLRRVALSLCASHRFLSPLRYS